MSTTPWPPATPPTPATSRSGGIRLTSNGLINAPGTLRWALSGPRFDAPLMAAGRRLFTLLDAADAGSPVGPILDRACDVRTQVASIVHPKTPARCIPRQASAAFLLATTWPSLPVWALRRLLITDDWHVDGDTVIIDPPATGVPTPTSEK